ncbi:hypothetical protein A2U01_0094986, partial [Trifolium medium]|nr:hypothetical protein [Trifolium medium]
MVPPTGMIFVGGQ